MADSTPIHSAISDAVTQSNVAVVAQAPAQALAGLYQVAGHSSGLALQNGTASQHSLNQITSAVVSKAVTVIMAIGEA